MMGWILYVTVHAFELHHIAKISSFIYLKTNILINVDDDIFLYNLVLF